MGFVAKLGDQSYSVEIEEIGRSLYRVAVDGNEFLVDGKLPLYSLAEHSDVDLDSDEVSTIGGYITSHLGHLPAEGETTSLEGYDITMTAVDSRKILRLRFLRKQSNPGSPEPETGTANH